MLGVSPGTPPRAFLWAFGFNSCSTSISNRGFCYLYFYQGAEFAFGASSGFPTQPFSAVRDAAGPGVAVTISAADSRRPLPVLLLFLAPPCLETRSFFWEMVSGSENSRRRLGTGRLCLQGKVNK